MGFVSVGLAYSPLITLISALQRFVLVFSQLVWLEWRFQTNSWSREW